MQSYFDLPRFDFCVVFNLTSQIIKQYSIHFYVKMLLSMFCYVSRTYVAVLVFHTDILKTNPIQGHDIHRHVYPRSESV